MSEPKQPEVPVNNPRWFRSTDCPRENNTPFRPAISIVGKTPTLWTAFSPKDSITIEHSFQSSKTDPRPNVHVVDVGEDQLYIVDTYTLTISPVYWDGCVYEIRRGIWFDSSKMYAPIEENLSNQLEDGFNKFKPWTQIVKMVAPIGTSDPPKHITNETVANPDQRFSLFGPYINQYVVYQGNYNAFVQTDLIYAKMTRIYSQGTLYVRGYEQTLKLQQKKPDESSGSRRSSIVKDKDEVEDLPRKIDNLILIIHGIGQKLGSSIESMNFASDVGLLRNTLRDCTDQVKAPLPDSESQKIPSKGGIQVLPIQWRNRLSFGVSRSELGDADVLVMEDIALDGIPGIRTLVSDVILDVLLYMTPKYRQRMISLVTNECNRIVKLYKKRNPSFEGKISIYGHSLGSVLGYDILSHEKTTKVAKSTNLNTEIDLTDLLSTGSASHSVKGLMPMAEIVYEPLEFTVDHFFAVGSPIGLFLLLSGVTKIESVDVTQDVQITKGIISRPDVNVIYNIFHPFDPVAHRLEPFVSSSMKNIKPFPVPYTKGGITQTIAGIQDMGADIVNRGFSIFESMRSGLVNNTSNIISTSFFAATAAVSEEKNNELKQPAQSLDNLEYPNNSKNSSIFMLNPHGRIDYVLQESILENPYLSSLGAHMSYWTDIDCAALILRAVHGIKHCTSKRMSVAQNLPNPI